MGNLASGFVDRSRFVDVYELGVEREICTSSSIISAGMAAGVGAQIALAGVREHVEFGRDPAAITPTRSAPAKVPPM
jgi:hypothetical protein